MKSYEKFKNDLLKNADKYFKIFSEYESSELIKNAKNNGPMEMLNINLKGSVNPNFSIDDMYRSYCELSKQGVEHPFNEILTSVQNQLGGIIQKSKVFDQSNITNFLDNWKNFPIDSRIFFKETNQDYMNKYIYTDLGNDFIETYAFRVDKQHFIPITFDIASYINVKAEDLRDMTCKKAEYEMINVGEILKNAGFPILDEMEDLPLYAITNESRYYGASVLGHPDKLAEFLHDDKYIVIPSSVHEILVLPFNDNRNVEELENMINEVNQMSLTQQEKLSDKAYFWDGSHIMRMEDFLKERETEIDL